MILKFKSCTSEEQPHTKDGELFNIKIVIIVDDQTTSTFALPLGNPTLLNSDNVYELLWDATMSKLDELEVNDKPFRIELIEELAIACLCSFNINNYPRPLIVLRLEEDKTDKVIKGLLHDNGVKIMGGRAAVRDGACSPCSCVICLDEAVPSGDYGGNEVDVMVAILLRCPHVFHVDCLVKWIVKCDTSNTYYSCPLCRSSLIASTNTSS